MTGRGGCYPPPPSLQIYTQIIGIDILQKIRLFSQHFGPVLSQQIKAVGHSLLFFFFYWVGIFNVSQQNVKMVKVKFFPLFFICLHEKSGIYELSLRADRSHSAPDDWIAPTCVLDRLTAYRSWISAWSYFQKKWLSVVSFDPDEQDGIKHYVGQILRIKGEAYEINFMRKTIGINKFVFFGKLWQGVDSEIKNYKKNGVHEIRNLPCVYFWHQFMWNFFV